MTSAVACRCFAADAGGSSGGERPPADSSTAAESTPSASSSTAAAAAVEAASTQESGALAPFRSESGKLTFQNYEQALDAWGSAMDQGDWGAAWDIFEGVLPVDDPCEFPALDELLAWDEEAEKKAERRQREEALQEAHAQRYVRRLDAQGRAFGVGKRKTSVALVWLKPGQGHMMVNKRPYDSYFPDILRRNDLLAPFLVTGTLAKFDVMARVRGGGATGQAQAIRHGVSRAMQNWEPSLRPYLKAAGLLTRDARIVERKKPGLKKARKAFQWVKR